MLCRVEMPSNEQIYARFFRHRLMQKGAGGSGIIVFPIIIAIVALLMFLLTKAPLLPLIILLLAGFYLLYNLVLRPKTLFSKIPGGAMNTEVYIFTENGFTRNLRNEESGDSETSSMQYSSLTEVVETKKDFFLFTSRTQAYLVGKEFFDKGTPEELRTVLQSTLGKRYRSK